MVKEAILTPSSSSHNNNLPATITSSMNTPRDRTLECAVCGKSFSRGHLDLTRHMNAITLQHLFTKEPTKDFPFHCDYGCGIFFLSEEHLHFHQQQTTCGRSKGSKKIRSFYDDLFPENTNLQFTSPPVSLPTPKVETEEPPLNSNDGVKITPTPSPNSGVNEAIKASDTSSTPNDVQNSVNNEEQQNKTPNNHRSLTIDTNTFDNEESIAIAENNTQPPQDTSQTKEMELSPTKEEIKDQENSNVEGAVKEGTEGVGESEESGRIHPRSETLTSDPGNLMIEATYSTEMMMSDFNMIGTPSQRRQDVKTMECMVCGKLFPRGPIDLQRHATAITLKHLVARKKSSSFNFGCARCGLFFTSQEHLTMHDAYTTCNPTLVWPHYAESMSGLRAIPKSQLSEVPPPPPPSMTPTMASNTPGSVSGRKSFGSVPPTGAPGSSPYHTKRKESFSKHNEDFIFTPLTGSGRVTRAHSHQFDFPSQQTPANGNNGAAVTGKRKRQLMTIDYENIRSKRTKYILPNERKTYFAIVSLLIDPQLVNAEDVITEDNYEQFIPQEHVPLLDKLKNFLQYTVSA